MRRGGILQLIEWAGQDRNIMVHRFDTGGRQINRGSKLTVREGQAAVFCLKGRMADVFPAGFYTLDTGNVPLLTRLMGWKYGFQSPFEVDIYFVNVTQFTNFKWGTVSPIYLHDANLGDIEIRGRGAYSFRISDPFKFLTELSGTSKTFSTQEIVDYLRGKILMGVSSAIGASNVPARQMAANLMALSEQTQKHIAPLLEDLGLELTRFIFEAFELPKEIQEAMRQNTAMGIKRQNFDMHLANRQMDVMGKAASNPGAGGPMNAMMGMGMGMGMGNMMGNMMQQNMQNVNSFGNPTQPAPQQAAPAAATKPCPHCSGALKADAMFCHLCGKPATAMCGKCNKPVKEGARFCASCGNPLQASCGKCNAPAKPGAKFCGGCGNPM